MYGHVITKFPRMGSLPHFFTHGAPLCALRARELRYDDDDAGATRNEDPSRPS